jgi:flagellar assembly protein FliH
MIEIIRAPKVNKRPRVLPCSQAKTNGANRARAATSKSPNAAKLNGSAVEQATDVNGGKAGPDKALHDALDQANHRADAAEQSLRQLQQEIEQQFADAKERGFDEGFRAGGEQSTKENEKCIAARLGSLDDLCADMRAEFDASLNDAVQDTVVEVVIAAAGKFLGDALTDRDSVVAVVEQMTRNVESSHTIRVRVSPADFDFLDTHDWAPTKRNGGPPLVFISDERIELGGCIVETSHGELDGRLETQLRRLKEVLMETRAKQLHGESE